MVMAIGRTFKEALFKGLRSLESVKPLRLRDVPHDEVERLAREHQPKLIIAGASAYPRIIEFARFRDIADAVRAE